MSPRCHLSEGTWAVFNPVGAAWLHLLGAALGSCPCPALRGRLGSPLGLTPAHGQVPASQAISVQLHFPPPQAPSPRSSSITRGSPPWPWLWRSRARFSCRASSPRRAGPGAGSLSVSHQHPLPQVCFNTSRSCPLPGQCQSCLHLGCVFGRRSCSPRSVALGPLSPLPRAGHCGCSCIPGTGGKGGCCE